MSNELDKENLNNLDDLESNNIQFDDEIEHEETLNTSPEDEIIDLSVNENGGSMPTKTKITLAIGLLLAVGSLGIAGYTKLYAPIESLPVAASQEPLLPDANQMLDAQFNVPSTEQAVSIADVTSTVNSNGPAEILMQLENQLPKEQAAYQSGAELLPNGQLVVTTDIPQSTGASTKAGTLAEAELKAANQELNNNSILISDLTEKNSKLSSELEDAKSQLKSASELNVFAKGKIDQLRNDLVNKSIDSDNLRDEISELQKVNTVGLLSDTEIDLLTNDRNRLPGFRVVGSSKDHSMSILATPSKRISVFFKGEKLIDRDNGVMTVDSVHHQGQIVLVGSKWYVDETLKERKPRTRKVKESPKVTKSVSTQKSSDSTSVDVTKLHISMNWEVNSIYNHKGDPRYLISSKSGDWKTVKIGDHIPGIGIVKGHIPDQGVVIGKTLVKVIKD